MSRLVVGWDIDGTTCHTHDAVDYESNEELLEACKPNAQAIRSIKTLIQDGHIVVFVTARGPAVRPATLQQLRTWLGDHADNVALAMRPGLIWSAEAMVLDKEAALRRHRVDIYVGDRSEDMTAALRAGARFVWAHRVHTFGHTAITAELHLIAGRREQEDGASAGILAGVM